MGPDVAEGERAMEKALNEFLRAGARLMEVWDEEKVKNYPDYLPDFGEFLFNFAGLMEKEREMTK